MTPSITLSTETLITDLPTIAPGATITPTPYPTRTPGVEAERATPTRGPRPTGLVIITATAVVPPSPTPTPTPLVSNLPGQIIFLQGDPPTSLWSFSMGTSQISSLLPDISKMGVLLQNMPPHALFASNQAIETSEIGFYQFPLPEVCLPENRCINLQYSPDGRYLAFTFNVDPEIVCGSTGPEVQVWEVATEEMILQIAQAGFSIWLSEGEFLYARSSCKIGSMFIWDLEMNESTSLGRGGNYFWSPDRRALAGYQPTFFGFKADFWLYDIENSQLFEPQQGEGGRYDSLCWHPESARLAYTWQEFQPPNAYDFTILPKQLWIMDAEGGEQHPLLVDADQNYIITTGNDRQWECQWLGDWLQVREVPYTPIIANLEPDDWSPLNCMLYGTNCINEKVLGINTVTGEVKDWHILTQEVLDAVQMKPDLASEPIFISSDNFFALYSGVNNRGLWYVPAEGKPSLLIPNGFDFVYINEDE